MKLLKIFVFLLLSTVAFTHVSFAQDDGESKPLFKSITIENQIASPLSMVAHQEYTFESQSNQTLLNENQHAETVQTESIQANCIADADYGNCSISNFTYNISKQESTKNRLIYRMPDSWQTT